MLRFSKIQKITVPILHKIPESTNTGRRSTTPLTSRSAFARKKIVIGPIQTIANKNRRRLSSKIQQEPSVSRITNENDGNLLVNNSSSKIFNQVNKSLLSKASFQDSQIRMTKDIQGEKSLIYLNANLMDNSPLKQNRKEVILREKEKVIQQELALTRAGNGCKLVSSLEWDQFEEMEKCYYESKGKVIESINESMLLESLSH